MKTIFLNLQQKLVLLAIFAITYAFALYFEIYNNLNNILIGDAAKSLTFIWTALLLTIINLVYRGILFFTKNNKFTKFLIRTNVEYGKVYAGLYLTTFIFLVQAVIVNFSKIITTWHENHTLIYSAVAVSILAFLIFPTAAAIVNYYLVKSFHKNMK